MNFSWIKSGWNDSSCSFPLISVTPLDPLAGGKVQEKCFDIYFNNFARYVIPENDV